MKKNILLILLLLFIGLNTKLFADCCYYASTPTLSASAGVIGASGPAGAAICNGSSVTLSASGSLNYNTYWAWYAGGCGVGGVTGATGNTHNQIVVHPNVPTTYYCRGEGGGIGPGSCGQITINNFYHVAAPVGTDASQCNLGSLVLSATVDTGATVDWYGTATGGSVLAGGSGTNSYTTPVISSTTTYYAQTRNLTTGCVSLARTPVNAIIGIVATASSNSPLCDGNTLNLNSSVGGTSYSWTGPNGFTSLSQNPTISAATTLAGGTYTVSISNSCGSSSSITLVTINMPTTSSASVTNCDSYLWNGTTYTSSGSYTYHTSNAAGCDSAANLNLTINHSSTSTTSVSVADSYTWNGTTFTTCGTFTFDAGATSNAQQCDSVATLVLNITNNTTSSTAITNCDSYVWNGTTYTLSGNYTYYTINAAGCGYTANLNLTIIRSSSSSTSVTAAGSYTWNGTTYTASGSYAYHTDNAAGCDSMATLNLIIPSTQIHCTISTDSCIVTNNEIKFRAIICNDGNTLLSFNAMTIRISFNSAILNGSPTITCNKQDTFLLAQRSDFPNVFQGPNGGGKWTDSYTTTFPGFSGVLVMNMTSAPSDYTGPGQGNDLLPGQCKVLGVFNIVSSSNFNQGVPVNLTWLTTSGTVMYVNGASTTSNFNTDTYRTLATPCTLTTCVAPSTPTAGCNNPMCAGSTLNLTSIVGAGNNLSYSWAGPNNFTSSLQNPTITAVSASASGTYTVIISNSCGSATSTTTSATLNANSTSSSSVTICDSYTWNGSTYTSSGDITYHTANSLGCDSAATLHLTILNPCVVTVNLKMFIQGYYMGSGTMQQVLLNEGVEFNPNSTNVDTVTISLVDPSNGNIVQTTKGVLQINGSLNVTIPGSVLGNSYYIYVQHRNSILTSSSSPVAFGDTTNYDFSISSSQAYGNNMAFVNGVWAIYTGDDNQDGYIDPFDFPAYDSDNSAQIVGVYDNTDFNGDGYVDPFDFPVYDQNNSMQIAANVPW